MILSVCLDEELILPPSGIQIAHTKTDYSFQRMASFNANEREIFSIKHDHTNALSPTVASKRIKAFYALYIE